MAGITGVRRGTGRERDEWFELLDGWGAVGRPYREIADWLMGEHDLSRWWAQKIIVEYEQERGVRPPGVRRDGTFEVTASKTIEAPATRVFEAFVDPKVRQRWLPGVDLEERSSRRAESARFDWSGGSSRVGVDFESKGRGRSAVAVSHERLATERDAQKMKEMWKERLTELKSFLET